MTSMEREEKEKVKKREKKLEDEETLQQATWVKYTIPIKHQVKEQLLLSPQIPIHTLKTTSDVVVAFKTHWLYH